MIARMSLALAGFVAAFALHAAEPASLKAGVYFGARATEYPAWFIDSFLDLHSDSDEAGNTVLRLNG